MPLACAYHRPQTLGEAAELLRRSNRIVLAGGTVVNADRAPSELEVVDLQALGLDAVSVDGDRVRIGATATLDALAGNDAVPDLVRRTARAELPSTLRTLATIGGTIAAGGGDSVLLAALLAHDAVVEVAEGPASALPFLLAGGVGRTTIITAVTIEADGAGAIAATGRTPADTPIVAALARATSDGVRLALTGVARRPVLVDPAEPTTDLDPPADFRGSREYRLELARVLSARAISEVGR